MVFPGYFIFFFPSQDIDTAIVSDTTDDLWFLNECPLEQGNAGLRMEVLDCEEVTEGDTKVPLPPCFNSSHATLGKAGSVPILSPSEKVVAIPHVFGGFPAWGFGLN